MSLTNSIEKLLIKRGETLLNYYIYDGELYSQEELQHYGVIGMKWGIRKGNYSETYKKATKKAAKLEKRTARLKAKSARATRKMLSPLNLIVPGLKFFRGFNAIRLAAKATGVEARGRSWTRKMEKNFANVKISDIDKEVLDAGRKYMYMLNRDEDDRKEDN